VVSKLGIVEIRISGKVPKNAIILEGFQGVGLVGTLSAQYIADKTNAEIIGYINSTLLPPMALLVNCEIKHPMRVYHFKNKGQDFIIFESELPLPRQLVHETAAAVAKFAEENGAKEIVCMEGLAVPKPPVESNVYGVTNKASKEKELSKYIKLLDNGVIIGVSAALMMEAKVRGITASCLMAEANADFPDGLAAASIILKLNSMYNLKIDTEELQKEAKVFEEKVWKVVEKAEALKDNMGETPKKNYIG
jgi:uncharacterized protein